MDIQTAISHVVSGQDLSRLQMRAVMQAIMQGQASAAQIGGLLVALRLKGERVDEIVAAAEVMRELSVKVPLADKTYLVDTCGTGGDGANTFNISTTAAFVVAAVGGKVAKHGNRSVSSKSGSADVLEAAGVKLALSPADIARCIETVGVGFMFAPQHHSSMKHVAAPRRELGLRTLFNVLGPLTNPAATPNQVIGVFSQDWLMLLAQALQQLGSDHIVLVHAADGMDEISIATKTHVVELKDDQIRQYEIMPSDFGMCEQSITALRATNVDESLTIMQAVLNNDQGAARDSVCLNAGAAVYVAGLADSIQAGVSLASEAIASGLAKQKFEQLIEYSQSC